MPYRPDQPIAEVMADLKARLARGGLPPALPGSLPFDPDAVDGAAAVPEVGAEVSSASNDLRADETVAEGDASPGPWIEVISADVAPYSASAWTGIRSVEEQQAVIRRVTPILLTGIDELIEREIERRPNDFSTINDLRSIRDHVDVLTIEAGSRETITEAMQPLLGSLKSLTSKFDDAYFATVSSPLAVLGIVMLIASIFGDSAAGWVFGAWGVVNKVNDTR